MGGHGETRQAAARQGVGRFLAKDRDPAPHEALPRRMSARFGLVIVAVVTVAACIYLVWTHVAQQQGVQDKALTEARTLNAEMTAVWDYIDQSQNAINFNADGSYDFKGIYCAVAGKGIARRFTNEAEGYVIRYVREDPRTATDEPDAFEQAALDSFREDASTTEYYGRDTYEGQSMFRYVSLLTIKHNCLDCHGSPAGEFDETGFIKEGMALGDMAGAVSIMIPLAPYEAEATAGLVRSVVFFVVLAVAIVLIVRFALNRWVTQPLKAANVRLRSENEAKADFLAVMSHELRTPLSPIIAFTEIWEKRMRERGGGAGREGADVDDARLLSEIKENSQVLLEMVNNTIDVAKIEENRLEITRDEVDVVDVLGMVGSVVEPLALKQGIRLTKHVDADVPIVYTDAEALRKIVMNLASNAVKFTERGGEVAIGVRMGDGERGAVSIRELVITVSDTGCGIPEEEFERIFGKFSQSGFEMASSSQGSGLGLYLVRTLAERLGGSVSVQSEVGRGSVFTVTLPLDPFVSDAGDLSARGE